MTLAPRRTRSVRMATVAAVAVAAALGASGAAGARPVPTMAHGPSSVVGTYRYTDTLDDTGELVVASDQTIRFSNGCSGLWVVRQRTIGFDFDSSSCFGTNIVFTGTIAGEKLSGTAEGLGATSPVAFRWKAVKVP